MTPIALVHPPIAMQPGAYVSVAYRDRDGVVRTPRAELDVRRTEGGWQVRLRWSCPRPTQGPIRDPSTFVDAAAVLAPTDPDAPWLTMGDAERPLRGLLWRADRDRPWLVEARGLGTVQRREAPSAWRCTAAWSAGHWQLELGIPRWPALEASGRVGVAIWQGVHAERAGLKSITPGWIVVR